jgi:hypothetical protein
MLFAIIAIAAVYYYLGPDEMKGQPGMAGAVKRIETANSNNCDSPGLTVLKPFFIKVSPEAAANIHKIVADYLKIKNALASDNAADASLGADRLFADLKMDLKHSGFDVEQQAFIVKDEDDLKENAQHINKAANDIGHQREHFVMLSEDIADLIRAFGSKTCLYTDHCPMADDQNGANWISETRQIRNPYLGNVNISCGTVLSQIRN